MRCPCCKQPLPDQKVAARVCHDCCQPMKRHDKWVFTNRDGYRVQVHRNCSDPTSYTEQSFTPGGERK